MTYDANTSITKQLRLPETRPSKRLLDAIGMFKGREKKILRELRAGRDEWEKRLLRQWKLGLKGRKHVAR